MYFPSSKKCYFYPRTIDAVVIIINCLVQSVPPHDFSELFSTSLKTASHSYYWISYSLALDGCRITLTDWIRENAFPAASYNPLVQTKSWRRTCASRQRAEEVYGIFTLPHLVWFLSIKAIVSLKLSECTILF